jgi:hypothetical protein
MLVPQGKEMNKLSLNHLRKIFWLLFVSLGASGLTRNLATAAGERLSSAPDAFRFDHSISRQVLENYLARSITMEGLLNGRGDLEDNIRMLKGMGAKFIGRSLCLWGGEANLLANLARAKQQTPKVHEADPDMILQACIFEIVTTQVEQVPIPDWAFTAMELPVEKRNFRYGDMLYADGRFKDHWAPGQSVPDVSRPETRLWFYFLGASFIDAGCEGIHLGQTELMNRNDRDLFHYSQVLALIRSYAAKYARRHMVICDSHVPSGGLVRDGQLLMDFHSFPLRIMEVPDKPQEAILKVGFSDGIYGRSKGGTTFSGWSCEHLPFLVEIDNWGVSKQPGQSRAGSIWIWGYDEISWFAHQSQQYRSNWLRYAWDWVRRTDTNAFLEMPGSRTLAGPVDVKHWYYANLPGAAVPDGFGDELAIRAIWALDTRSVTPEFGTNVLIFDSTMTNIQSRIDEIFRQQERSQFGSNRYAYLFKPGNYALDVQVGFYMQVLGLGRLPDDVTITGAVRSKARWLGNNNATCNFWRCVENLAVVPTEDDRINIWAVSQATAVRRVHVKGDLNLWDGGWSSGGFMADSVVDGQVNSGSQQQWFSRNTHWGRWKGGSWNMVFVGTKDPPVGNWPEAPYTVIDKTPVIREKPFLFIDEAGRYFVRVPDLATNGAVGITWSRGETPGISIPVDQFYLARPEVDTAATLNTALSQGKHLLITPGIYLLEDCIRVTHPGTVVLGLGFPTLQPVKGTSVLRISDVDGVKVAGVLVDAGTTNSETLVEVGEPGSKNSHAADPIILWDLFCRAGGAHAGSTTCMVTINSNDVVGDNFWLWRADHGRGAGWTSNPNKNGLIVHGNNVTLYGLFVEHQQEYQTLWIGNGGRVYFYQSEMPYDPPSQDWWRHGAVNGYASYKVADTVTTHEAWGLGVYCVFYAAPVLAENAFETPDAPGVRLHHLVTIRLSGKPNSGISHVINGTGAPVITNRKATMD